MVQTAEQRTRLLAERVGFAMTAFAMIETQLGFLFAASVSLPINISARMLASVKSFSTTLEVIDVAVRHKLEGSGALPYCSRFSNTSASCLETATTWHIRP